MSYRQDLFPKILVPAEFAAFRASYEGINPDRPLETYWWIFGDECLMGMLRSTGFKDVKLALNADCDSRNPDNPRVTVESHPAGARAWFTATKA